MATERDWWYDEQLGTLMCGSWPYGNRATLSDLEEKIQSQLSSLTTRLEAAEGVIEAAERFGDSNFRKMEEGLRKGSWNTVADHIQGLRKALAHYSEVTKEAE